MKINEATRLLHPVVKLARLFRSMTVNTRVTDNRWSVEYVERDGQHIFHYRVIEGENVLYKIVVDIGGCIELPMRNEYRLMAMACYMRWQIGWDNADLLQHRYAKTTSDSVVKLPELYTLARKQNPYKMGKRVWLNGGRLAGEFVCMAHHLNAEPLYLIHLDRNVNGRWYLATADQMKAEPRSFTAPAKYDWIIEHPC